MIRPGRGWIGRQAGSGGPGGKGRGAFPAGAGAASSRSRRQKRQGRQGWPEPDALRSRIASAAILASGVNSS